MKIRAKHKAVTLPPLKPRLSAETALRRIAERPIREIAALKSDMLRAATIARAELRTDAIELDVILRTIRSLSRVLADVIRSMVRRLLGVESVRHTDRWIEQVNSAIGVSLRGVVAAEDVSALIELATERAAGLITGLSDEMAKRVSTTLLDMIVAGKSTKAIATALDEQFAFGKRRAAFIARDQIAKFNAALNRIRQQQAGVTEYVWWTMQDERVRGNPSGRYPSARPSHWGRHGKTFRIDSPPSDGAPGEAINCRCIARPVLKAG